MKEISRKEFLKQGVVAGAVGTAAIALAYCKKKGGEEASAPAGGACNDLSGLTQAEKDTRTQLQYKDKSDQDGKVCNGCALFVPAPAGAACASCNLVKGPISPEGYCTSWVKKG